MVEVLLAMALGGLVLAAASALLVTLAQAWANRPATRDAFDAHVNGVAHFLTAVLEEASLPNLNKQSVSKVDTQKLPFSSGVEDEELFFYLRETPPLFVWPHGPATRTHLYLLCEENEGLSFLWFSELQELEKNDEGLMEPEDEDELKKTLISRFCKSITYWYYGEADQDPTQEILDWYDYEDELRESEIGNDYDLPDFIELHFTWEDEGLERSVLLAVKDLDPSGLEEEPK